MAIKLNVSRKKVYTPIEEKDYELSPEQKSLFELIENSSQNIFIQGQAGTGKSTFVQYLKKHSKKQLTIVSPTAVAAIILWQKTNGFHDRHEMMYLCHQDEWRGFHNVLPEHHRYRFYIFRYVLLR